MSSTASRRRWLLPALVAASVIAGCDSKAPEVVPGKNSPSPRTSAVRSYGPTEADGISYGIVTNVSGPIVTYDKIDYLQKACEARTPDEMVSEPRSDQICFRNQNPLLRQTPLADGARITVVSEGGDEASLTAVQFSNYGACCPGPNRWIITIRQGLIVRLHQFNVAGD